MGGRHWLLLAAAASLLSAPLAALPPAATAPISAARLDAMDKLVASDAFQGRGPGTIGETRTIAWLVARLKALGLQPAAPGGGWTQKVPLVRTQLGEGAVTVTVGGKRIAFTPGDDIYLNTVRPTDRVTIAGAPLVFEIGRAHV